MVLQYRITRVITLYNISRNHRLRANMADNCKKGYGCGQSCISRLKGCDKLSEGEVTQVINNFVGLVEFITEKITKDISNPAKRSLKAKVGREARGMTPKEAEKHMEETWKFLSTSFTPEEAEQALQAKIELPSGHPALAELGANPTYEQYGDWTARQPWYDSKAGKKAKGSDDSTREEADRRMYELPGMKIRGDVSDAEVDFVWNNLPQRLKDNMFHSASGQPKRDEPPNRVDLDWASNTPAMRKGMVKAFLQQIVTVDGGNSYLYDPKSPTGKVEVPPSLDHVVPLAKGGTHTVENWVYTSEKTNSTKSNNTLAEEVESLRKIARGTDTQSAVELYNEKKAKGIKSIMAVAEEDDMTDLIRTYGASDNYAGALAIYQAKVRGSGKEMKGAFMKGLEAEGKLPVGFARGFRDKENLAELDNIAEELLSKLDADQAEAMSYATRLKEKYEGGSKGNKPDYSTYKPNPERLPVDLLAYTSYANEAKKGQALDIPSSKWDKVAPLIDKVFPISEMPADIQSIFPNNADQFKALSKEDKAKLTQFLLSRGIIVSYADLSREKRKLVSARERIRY